MLEADNSSNPDNFWKIDKGQLYIEFCTKIRATDDISFKLLGFVPLLSGSAIFLLLFKGEEIKTASVILLCIAGAAVTIGLFLWEQRNIKTCLIFRDAAAELEKEFPNGWIKPNTMMDKPEPKYSSILRKTEAERIIYAASILVWIIPIINQLSR